MVQPGRRRPRWSEALVGELDWLRGEPISAARAGAREEPVRPRLHRRARVEPAEGAAARARDRDPQGRRDYRRRRVRHLHGDDGGGRAAVRKYFTPENRTNPRRSGPVRGEAGRGPCRRDPRARRPSRQRSASSLADRSRPAEERTWPSSRPAAAARPRREVPAGRAAHAAERPPGRRGDARRAAGDELPRSRTRGRAHRTRRGSRAWARCVAGLLDQGTTRRSAQQIADTIDSGGGDSGTGGGTGLLVRARDRHEGRPAARHGLLADVASPPASRDELERQRQQPLAALRVGYADPEYLANVVFDRLVYGSHPYGIPERYAGFGGGDHPRRLGGVPRAYFVPNNCFLAVVGDVTRTKRWKRSPSVRRLGEA